MGTSKGSPGLRKDGLQVGFRHAMLTAVVAAPALDAVKLLEVSLARLLSNLKTTGLRRVLRKLTSFAVAEATLDTGPRSQELHSDKALLDASKRPRPNKSNKALGTELKLILKMLGKFTIANGNPQSSNVATRAGLAKTSPLRKRNTWVAQVLVSPLRFPERRVRKCRAD